MEFRQYLQLVFATLSAFIILGSLLNDQGDKFSFSKKVDSTCSRYILTVNVPDSHMCCDKDYHDSEWVCIAVFDTLSRFLSSTWAWVLPITPAIITILVDLIIVILFKWKRQEVMADTFASTSLPSVLYTNFHSLHLQRLLPYIGIILIRAFILYLLPETVMDLLYSHGYLAFGSCWCPEYVSKKKCEMRFDFSDHIVLFMVQYTLIITMEFSYIMYNRIDANIFLDDKSGIGLFRFLYYIPVVACCGLFLLCIRAAFLTALFFHSPSECAVGLIISWLSSWFIVKNVRLSRTWRIPFL